MLDPSSGRDFKETARRSLGESKQTIFEASRQGQTRVRVLRWQFGISSGLF